MTFSLDATEESEDYFFHEKLLQIPNHEEDDPLNILLHEEAEYIQTGIDAVRRAHANGEEFEEHRSWDAD